MSAAHPNSTAAFDATSRERTGLQARIMELMEDNQPRTDREIQKNLNHPEAIRPRICALIKAGHLIEVGSKVCQWTGQKVRLTRRFL